MSAAKRKTPLEAPLYKVGDRVRLFAPPYNFEGVIVEDRGNIGRGGRRLYGIQFKIGEELDRYTERGHGDFELATEPAKANESNR